jgi:hypothetical protein
MRITGGRSFVPTIDPVIEAMRNGDGSIDFLPPDRSFSNIVLAPPLRNYFIKVKGWLMKAIVKLTDQHIQQRLNGKEIGQTSLSKAVKVLTQLLPEPNKRNSDALNAHTIDSVFERFFSYVKFKPEMFREALKVIRFELGHDQAYDDAFQILLEEIIKEILRGNWKVRKEEPYPLFWSNQTPKGGKHSIISILQNKKDLENLLGDKWRLE